MAALTEHDRQPAFITLRERYAGIWRAMESARRSKQKNCPHAAPFRYCETCVADPCPIGLGSALKREPNAAARETDSEVTSISSDRVRTPAPAAPVAEMVMVPREIGELAQDMVATMERQPGYKLAITHGRILRIAKEVCRLYELSKLSAAEANEANQKGK